MQFRFLSPEPSRLRRGVGTAARGGGYGDHATPRLRFFLLSTNVLLQVLLSATVRVWRNSIARASTVGVARMGAAGVGVAGSQHAGLTGPPGARRHMPSQARGDYPARDLRPAHCEAGLLAEGEIQMKTIALAATAAAALLCCRIVR